MSDDRPLRFVTKTMTVVINALVIARTGGTRATRTNLRPGMTLGFIERIHGNEVFGQPIYPDLYHQAAAYMYYIIKNHAFLDGNKRTGLAAAVTFLMWNGRQVRALDEDATFDFVVDLAHRGEDPEIAVPRIAAWLQTVCS